MDQGLGILVAIHRRLWTIINTDTTQIRHTFTTVFSVSHARFGLWTTVFIFFVYKPFDIQDAHNCFRKFEWYFVSWHLPQFPYLFTLHYTMGILIIKERRTVVFTSYTIAYTHCYRKKDCCIHELYDCIYSLLKEDGLLYTRALRLQILFVKGRRTVVFTSSTIADTHC